MKTNPERLILLGLTTALILSCTISVNVPTTPPPEPSRAASTRALSPTQPRTTSRPTSPPATIRPTTIVTKLPPIPDFDDTLTFGGGGTAGWGCIEEQYSHEPNSINVLGRDGKSVWLCVHWNGRNPALPMNVSLTHLGDPPMRLESGNLLFDKNADLILWEGFSQTGAINYWATNGSVYFTLILWLPTILPQGTWRFSLSQPDGYQLSKDIELSRPGGEALISALDPQVDRELMTSSPFFDSHELHKSRNGNVAVYGVGYPPNSPVYIVLYRDDRFVQAQVVLSDASGSVTGELSGVDVVGNSTYMVYGLTNPNTKLDGADFINCSSVLRSISDADCDYFQILPEAIPPLATATSHAPLSCPGAPPQRMTWMWSGYVCTRSESVRLRVSPSRQADTIDFLLPGTQFKVIGGSRCADNWSWWQIQLDNGITGWVAEGGDEIDPYFICPLD